ncbi:unnamed protein product, partial [Rotaria sordida]
CPGLHCVDGGCDDGGCVLIDGYVLPLLDPLLGGGRRRRAAFPCCRRPCNAVDNPNCQPT